MGFYATLNTQYDEQVNSAHSISGALHCIKEKRTFFWADGMRIAMAAQFSRRV